jgi:Eukaryotic protein of unknown function (DUF866)
MVLFALSFKADLENLESLTFPEDHRWVFSFEDESGQRRDNVGVLAEEEVEIPGSKGVANVLLKFPETTKAASILITSSKLVNSKYTDSVGVVCRRNGLQADFTLRRLKEEKNSLKLI